MKSAQALWSELENNRSQYIQRAIDCSSLTIPTLIPDNSMTWGSTPSAGSSTIPSLHQGTGARGVNELAAKLLLTLMPPNQPFFKLQIEEGKIRRYLESNPGTPEENVISKLEEKISLNERILLTKVNKIGARYTLFEHLKHLIVGGNGMIYISKNRMRFFPLRQYVCRRNAEGDELMVVIREVLDSDQIEQLTGVQLDEEHDDRDLDLYTVIEWDRDENKVEWHQEFDGKEIPKSAGFAPLESSPWIVNRWYPVAGEDYGRSLVEECIGDLNSLEQLSRAVTEGGLISAKTVFLVNPNGSTRADAVARARNGDVVNGNPNDVAALESGKNRDYATGYQLIQLIEKRLNYVFLSSESYQRDAERVTAEEIRMMAQELEKALGGTYSILSETLMAPMIRCLMRLFSSELPDPIDGIAEPTITTGLDAIGRGNDKVRLLGFMSATAQALGPEQFARYINPTELIRRLASADGIDVKGLVKDEQTLQREQSQAQQLQLASQLSQGAMSNGAIPTAAGGSPGAGGQPGTGERPIAPAE